mgnify:CR=1 FL=1
MAEEIVDTNPDLYPQGEAGFTCVRVDKKLNPSNKPYYIFVFSSFVDGYSKPYKEIRAPWMSGDLIVALGGTDEGNGKFKWDRSLVAGKKIICSIVHEPDFKDKTRLRARITNPVPVDETIPF